MTVVRWASPCPVAPAALLPGCCPFREDSKTISVQQRACMGVVTHSRGIYASHPTRKSSDLPSSI
jgi:hypothetical protein